jgi:hypothetical protein
MSSTAQIKWIIWVWQVFSEVLLLQDLGDVSMSLIDWYLKSYLYVLYNLNQLQMLLKLKNQDLF